MAVDLTTFAGVALVVTALIEAAKRIVPIQVVGRERIIALALTAVICLASKAMGLGFGETDWLSLVIGAVITSAASGAVHEHVVRKPKNGGAGDGAAEGTPP